MNTALETFCPKSRQEWRQWLVEYHNKKQSIWLIYYKKDTSAPTISYNDAVDEALCFGWIDSESKPLDEERYMQFFSRRKESSVWSKVNKEKIERLISENLMTEAGYQIIETARQNGSWTMLDDAEALIIPEDLAKAFEEQQDARKYFQTLSRSDQRNILQWLVLAKRDRTRQNRINEIVKLAQENQKPKQFRGQRTKL